MELTTIIQIDHIYEKVLSYLGYNQKLKLRLVNKDIYKATNRSLNRSINYIRSVKEQPANKPVSELFADLNVRGIETHWDLFSIDSSVLNSITHLRIGDGVFLS